MRPTAHDHLWIVGLLRTQAAEAQEDSPDIPQIEEVVTLRRRRQQVLQGLLEDAHRAVDGLRDQLPDSLVEGAVEEVADRAEYLRDGLVLELGVRQRAVVPLQALRDERSATAGRSHSGHHDHIRDVELLQLLAVEPTAVVVPLPNELDGRLCAVVLLDGHVQVVDEEHHLLARGRPVDAAAALLELGVNEVLELVHVCLRRKVDVCALEVLRRALREPQRDVDTLASACWARAKHMLVLQHQELEAIHQSHRVDRRNHDLLVTRPTWHFVSRKGFHPRDPLLRLRVVEVVEQGATQVKVHKFDPLHRWERYVRGELALVDLLAQLHGEDAPDIVRERGPAGSVGAPAQRPQQAEKEQRANARLELCNLFLESRSGSQLVRPELDKVAIQKSEQGLDEVVVLGLHDLLQLLSHKCQGRRDDLLAQLRELLANGGLEGEGLRQDLQPRVEKGQVAETLWLHVDHSTPRHRCRRGNLEILDFELHPHLLGQGNNLAANEAQLLVVIEDGVHAFDPERVHRTIEHDPMVVGAGRIPDGVADLLRSHAVGPLPRHVVEGAVELILCDGLRIQAMDVHFLVGRVDVRVLE
mmetsp:Transcript_120675/g.385300  ORF Transcript_120675/g.385300 Transcript_120675/m.385300 type:complete len:585 (+) Transcript_120675:5572-7326(+)